MSPQLTTPEPSRHARPTARATSLAYLLFERPDLDLAERFLLDFGLTASEQRPGELSMRGTDPDAGCYLVRQAPQARFVGLGFTVGSEGELQALAQLPGASPVSQSERPGGGLGVVLHDPSGFQVEAVYGRGSAPAIGHRAPMQFNTPHHPKRVNRFQRPPMAPPEVVRLGHVVLETAEFQATCGWYTRHFGLIPSDVQVLPDGSPAVVFLRLNLGDEPADHHTLALAQGFMSRYSHSAYELVDADAVGMGQRLLRERGWKHAWGVGRHILGSQIFDYWQDPWGDKHEHYCDGDVLTDRFQTGVHAVSREAMSQWGPVMPASFTRPRLSLHAAVSLLRNLRRSPDLSLRKLMQLARLFG